MDEWKKIRDSIMSRAIKSRPTGHVTDYRPACRKATDAPQGHDDNNRFEDISDQEGQQLGGAGGSLGAIIGRMLI